MKNRETLFVMFWAQPETKITNGFFWFMRSSSWATFLETIFKHAVIIMSTLFTGNKHRVYRSLWRSRQQLALQNFRRNANNRLGICHVWRVHHRVCCLSDWQSVPWHVRITGSKELWGDFNSINFGFQHSMESDRVFELCRHRSVHSLCRHHSQGLEWHEGTQLLATKHNTNGSHMRHWSHIDRRRGHLLGRLALCGSLGSSWWASISDYINIYTLLGRVNHRLMRNSRISFMENLFLLHATTIQIVS